MDGGWLKNADFDTLMLVEGESIEGDNMLPVKWV